MNTEHSWDISYVNNLIREDNGRFSDDALERTSPHGGGALTSAQSQAGESAIQSAGPLMSRSQGGGFMNYL